MQSIRIISALGVAVMTVAVIHGFTSGDFAAEGSAILDLAWGRVTLVDIYVGVGLFGAFVAWREQSAPLAAGWIIAFVVLGNLATAGYVLLASLRAETVEELLTGRISDRSHPPGRSAPNTN